MAQALVTGASSGIGLAFADELARHGYNLVLVGRNRDKLAQVAERLSSSYDIDAEVMVADLAVSDDVQQVAERLEDVQHPIDLLVNNAGFAAHNSLLDADTAPQEKAIAVMITAVLKLSGAAGRSMSGRGHGGIINIGSANAFLGADNYSAIKRWVITFTQALAAQLDGTGVHVVVSCPGWVKTEFHARAGLHRPHVPAWAFTPARVVVRTALADLKVGRVMSVPTAKWKFAVWVLRHGPDSLTRRLSAKVVSGHTAAAAQSWRSTERARTPANETSIDTIVGGFDEP